MTKFKSVDIRRFTRSIVRWLPEINPEFVYDTLLKLDRRFTAEDIPQYVRYFENCLYGKGGDSMLDMEKILFCSGTMISVMLAVLSISLWQNIISIV